jgi:hypothetical protein
MEVDSIHSGAGTSSLGQRSHGQKRSGGGYRQVTQTGHTVRYAAALPIAICSQSGLRHCWPAGCRCYPCITP